MKLASIATLPLPCTCGTHLLAQQGDLCEICMGAVYSHEDQEFEQVTSRFDTSYFEALEALQVGMERAA